MIVSSGLVIASSMVLGSVPKALAFFFFIGFPEQTENKWGAFLEDDKFKRKHTINSLNKHLFDELTKIKDELKLFLESREKMDELTGGKGGAKLVDQITNHFTLQIKKIRLMIEFPVYTNEMKKGKDLIYVVAKTIWLDHNGKSIKKFTKVLGRKEDVLAKGFVKSIIMKEAIDGLSKTMWNQYQSEYYSNKTK